MTSTLNIAPLIKDDIGELINLVNGAYRGESSKKGWTTEADLLDGSRTDDESVQALLAKEGSIVFTAKDKASRMVGCVYLQQQANQLYLGMLTVAPDIQDRGIGKQLMFAAEKYARENNCTSIIMSVIDVRKELIDWYKRKGYRATGETKPFPAESSFGIPKQPLQFMILEKKI